MKKIFLFLTLAALVITSCNSDDNARNEETTATVDLAGTWLESGPNASNFTVIFTDTTVTINSELNENTHTYNYTFENNTLHLTTPGSDIVYTHYITPVNHGIMKMSNLYIQVASNNAIPILTTFEKQHPL